MTQTVERTTTTRTRARKARAAKPKRAARSPLEIAADDWWESVQAVHEVLVARRPGMAKVSQVFAAERAARASYATALADAGRRVPPDLDPEAPPAPLWPAPERPT